MPLPPLPVVPEFKYGTAWKGRTLNCAEDSFEHLLLCAALCDNTADIMGSYTPADMNDENIDKILNLAMTAFEKFKLREDIKNL